MSDQRSNRFLHDLRQPIAAIMNFAGAGARMADQGADHRTLKDVFAQIHAQAERLGELCKPQENSTEKGSAGTDQ